MVKQFLSVILLAVVSLMPMVGASAQEGEAPEFIQGTPNDIITMIAGYGILGINFDMQTDPERVYISLPGKDEFTLEGELVEACTGSGATQMCNVYKVEVSDMLFWMYNLQAGFCVHIADCVQWQLVAGDTTVNGPYLEPMTTLNPDGTLTLSICAATALIHESEGYDIFIHSGECAGGDILLIRSDKFSYTAHLGENHSMEYWQGIEAELK